MNIGEAIRTFLGKLSREQMVELLCWSYGTKDVSFPRLMEHLAASEDARARQAGVNCRFLYALDSCMKAGSAYLKSGGANENVLQEALTDLQACGPAEQILPSFRTSTRHALIRLIASHPELGERLESICFNLCTEKNDYLDLAGAFESLGMEPWPSKADAIYREFADLEDEDAAD